MADDDLALGERAGRPNLSVNRLKGDDDDQKAEKVAAKVREVDREVLHDLETRVEKELSAALEGVRPNRDRTEQRIRKAAEDALESWRGYRADLYRYLANRRSEAEEELPNVTAGQADPAESDVRDWVRSAADAETRGQRINTVVRSGNPAQLRALFRESVPAQAAGFASEQHRQTRLREALQVVAPESFETARSIGEELERIEEDAQDVEIYGHRLRNAAMAAFDEAVKGRS